MSVPPVVSVVVPAYDAAATISSTLSRLSRQSFRGFEVIVVDDGSTDETASLAEAAMTQDPRIRVLRTTNGGVSSARNRGLADATGPWVLFLDADDWLHDQFLERMLAALSARPGSRVARCRHARVAPSGALMAGPEVEHDDRLFDSLARRAVGAVHAYLTETALVREVGGFDETLVICEDWDLWQRVARTGAPVAVVEDVLAFYRMRSGSLSGDGARLLVDARTVLVRGMSADHRVAHPDPRWARGVTPYDVDVALQPIAVWCASWALASGRPWRPLLDEVHDWTGAADQQHLIHAFFEGFLLGRGLVAAEVAGSVDELASAAQTVLGEVAARSGRPVSSSSWSRGLADVLVSAGVDGLGVRNLVVPTDGLLPSVPGAPDGERLVVELQVGTRSRRLVDTVHWRPVDRGAMARLLLGAIAQCGYGALRRRVLDQLPPPAGPWTPDLLLRLRRRAVALVQEVGWRAEDLGIQRAPTDLQLSRSVAASVEAERVADPGPTSPEVYWEGLFSEPDPWTYDSDYERVKYERTLAMLEGLRIGRALELGCAEGHFTRELAAVVEHLRAVDISAAALTRAAERCADRDNVDLVRSDFFREEIPGTWDLVVCSEVLYYTDDEGLLADVAARVAAALAPDGVLLSAHAHVVVDDPAAPGFDWDFPFGAKRIFEVLAEAGDLVPVRRLVTPLYSIGLFRHRRDTEPGPVSELVRDAEVDAVLAPHVGGHVLWSGAVRTRRGVSAELGYDVPILMYHRITDRPAPGLSRWAVSPAALERQMEFLRRRGFRTVSMHELVQARHDGRPLPGRPVVLTFDDAYVDFLENGLPALHRRGFSGTVFVPTGHLGGAAEWDSRFGPAAPIMDRAQLSTVAGLGFELGSHLHSHTRVDQLSFDDLLRESLESRRVLSEITGSPPQVVATPFGFVDRPALSVLRTAGFELVATTDQGVASLVRAGRTVPRLEVADGSLAHLHALLGPGIEPPTSEERAAETEQEASVAPSWGAS